MEPSAPSSAGRATCWPGWRDGRFRSFWSGRSAPGATSRRSRPSWPRMAEGEAQPDRALRRLARQVALQALYESDAVRHPIGAVVERLSQAGELPPEAADLARRLVAGV